VFRARGKGENAKRGYAAVFDRGFYFSSSDEGGTIKNKPETFVHAQKTDSQGTLEIRKFTRNSEKGRLSPDSGAGLGVSQSLYFRRFIRGGRRSIKQKERKILLK